MGLAELRLQVPTAQADKRPQCQKAGQDGHGPFAHSRNDHHAQLLAQLLDEDIPLRHLPCLDLYNPEDPFRLPTIRELSNPINLVEWLGVSTMGFPEPFTFGIRAYLFLKHRWHNYDENGSCFSQVI